MTPCPGIPSLLSSSHPVLLLLYCKKSKYCFPVTLLREGAIVSFIYSHLGCHPQCFYVKRGGQLHGDEIWPIVWFSVSFCSAPMIILCLFLWERFKLYPEPFIGNRIQKIWAIDFQLQRKEIMQHLQGHIRSVFQCFPDSDWPTGLGLEYFADV